MEQIYSRRKKNINLGVAKTNLFVNKIVTFTLIKKMLKPFVLYIRAETTATCLICPLFGSVFGRCICRQTSLSFHCFRNSK